MAAIEGSPASPFSVAAVVEDVLQQHRSQSRGLDLDARRAEEDAIRRYEAASWLRKLIGVVAAKDLPAEPSEEEFRLGLRSGIILCNVLNKTHPGSVQKVVENPHAADGAALLAFQYFENVRNFLVKVEEMGMPTFEASDLEQGGKPSRVVNCVLALKSYSIWKQSGGNGVWKFGGNVKTAASGKQFLRKNSEPFTTSPSVENGARTETDLNRTCNSSLSMLVRAVLLDKKPDEVPNLVESVLSKVMEEFENRVASQLDLKKANFRDSTVYHGNKSILQPSSSNVKNAPIPRRDDASQKNGIAEESESNFMKQLLIVDQQQNDVTVLKQNLSTAKAGMQFMQMKFNEEIHNIGLHIHGLAHAASSYHRVLDENRKLYNQVQDLKGNIRVYCRVRPFLPGQLNQLSTVDHIEEGGTISITTPAKNGKGRKSFNFNKVFGPSATQDEVFSDTQPLIRSVLDGYNVCIFAYGQTGSGKTYTMTGPKVLTEDSQGVNFRALHDLFLLAEQRKGTFWYDVSVQMMEIYNEQVRDLLNTDGLSRRLEIRNSSQSGLSVPGASLVHVSSTSEIIDLMNIGHRNRAVGATALNDRSSRSHSCLTVHVQGRDLTSGNILRGCMHLVDLAGSERVDKSEATGDRLKEAQHINKSLSALGDVIYSLAQKSSHVPYRNSKLTQLLQDSLGGQAKTLMFVHVSPEPEAVGETISTLKFAERVATVELGAARVNKDSSDVKELKEQIATLKAALARKEGETTPMQTSPFQPNRVGLQSPNELKKTVENVGTRKKRQSIDLDELLRNSPTWPPTSSSSPSQTNARDDRELTSSGDWVDKVMVNKQDHVRRLELEMDSWSPNQKYLSDSSKYYTEFDVNGTDDLDELDAGTSDSSEPDLLWQFNNSKIGSFGSGVGTKLQKPNSKESKSNETRSMIPKLGPSPSRKFVDEGGRYPPRNGRQGAEIKRKPGNRK